MTDHQMPPAPTDVHPIDAQMVHELFSMWDKEVPTAEEMRQWFADDLVFIDPLQRTDGLDAYYEMNLKLLKQRHDLNIHMEESAQTGNHIMFTFSLDMAPVPRFPEKRIYNTGTTYVRLNDEGKTDSHQDYWDFNTMFLSAFPGFFLKIYKKFVGIFA